MQTYAKHVINVGTVILPMQPSTMLSGQPSRVTDRLISSLRIHGPQGQYTKCLNVTEGMVG
jgi:hypothetical protein